MGSGGHFKVCQGPEAELCRGPLQPQPVTIQTHCIHLTAEHYGMQHPFTVCFSPLTRISGIFAGRSLQG